MGLSKLAKGVQMDREAVLAAAAAEKPQQTASAADVDVRERTKKPAAASETSNEAAPAKADAPKVDRVVGAEQSAAAKRSTKRGSSGRTSTRPQQVTEDKEFKDNAYTIALTEEQWDWVKVQVGQKGGAQRFVILAAVAEHQAALIEHFRTATEEGPNLFRWKGEPKDVEGKKTGKSVRFEAAERSILQGLIDKSGAPSMSIYLRAAVDMEMKRQGVAG